MKSVASFSIVRCPSDGTLNGAPCQGLQPPWHAKDRFTGFRWREKAREDCQGKFKISKLNSRYMAERLPIRRKTISNQSIIKNDLEDTPTESRHQCCCQLQPRVFEFHLVV